MPLFLILGLLGLAFGVLSLTSATAGVGGIAAGCFFLIAGRLYQANEQHRAIMRVLKPKAEPAAEPVSAAQPAATVAPDGHSLQCANCGAITRRGPSQCPTCNAPLRGATVVSA